MDLSTARARIHALLPVLDNPTEADTRETETDQRIDDLLATAQARIAELETQREALAARLRAGQRWKQGRTQPLVSQDYVSQDELRAIFGIPLTPPWESTDNEPAVCRCDEPDADPYACEADDCSYEFSELNPFGSGARPVNVASAEVSRTCGCGWRTNVWHVDDGSAEEELHGHVVRVHGGTYPAPASTSA